MEADRQNSKVSSVRRSFFSSTTKSTTGDDSIEQGIGPLGLTTLYEPTSEFDIADLVFVHGLRGGSRKTWTKSNDASLFWPQTWLPQDEAFKRTRIHTFGYDSNWQKGSTLRILDFSRALLGAVSASSSIPRSTTVRIRLVYYLCCIFLFLWFDTLLFSPKASINIPF